MLLGSSRPYPWLILEEHGRWIDDDDSSRVDLKFYCCIFLNSENWISRIPNILKVDSIPTIVSIVSSHLMKPLTTKRLFINRGRHVPLLKTSSPVVQHLTLMNVSLLGVLLQKTRLTDQSAQENNADILGIMHQYVESTLSKAVDKSSKLNILPIFNWY